MEMNKEIKDFILQSLSAVENRLGKTIAGIQDTVKKEIENTLGSRLTNIEKKLVDIENSQQFQADQYKTFRTQVGNLMRENIELKKENESLAFRIIKLEKKDDQRAKTIDDLEQYGRREMLEFGGIPRDDKENCEVIVLNIAEKIDIPLKEDDIEACHRISRRPDAPIIVKFKSRKKKEQFMSKESKTKAKKLRTTDLGYDLQPDPNNPNIGKTFINESLSSRLKNLLRLTKIKKQEMNIKFIWTRNGSIFLRKDEKAPALKMKRRTWIK